MKHTVIGTAGHIDHGKTMLLKALTGIDADRLPEEKERGMTIDLGFVFLGNDVTIIDVPGHEKFIKNMLAGVSTIDLVILVIAADDGIMPQTREHFEIIKLLDIRHGIVVITKIDLVDREWLELVKEDTADFVKESFLENAPVVYVSSITGEGIPEFKNILEEMITQTPARQDKGVFRLWVDRVFVLKGIGTVTAGTVLSGILQPGAKLELLPQKKEVRVRKLQVHNEDVNECRIGERVAINLIGVEVDEIERGNLLAQPEYFEPTYIVNAKLYLLRDAKSLVSRTRVRFHIGSRELLARVVLLDKKSLDPGESTLVQFRLEEPVAVEIGDHYIIRSYSPAYTIGGGTLIEVHPKKLKYLPVEELEKLDKLEKADPEQVLLHHLANNPLELQTAGTAAREISLRREDVQNIIMKLIREKSVTVIKEKPVVSIVLTEHFENAQKKIINFLTQYHRKFPYRRGVKQSELKNKLFGKIDNSVYDAVLSQLIKKNKAAENKETIYLYNHRITFTPRQEEIKNKIEELYLKSKYVTPSSDEAADQFPEVKKQEILNILTGMVELGILTEIKTEVEKPALFHSKNVEEAEKILVDLLRKKGEIRLFEFREKINSTRKFATPLLIYFDRKGITERKGEIRTLKTA
ncbi:hypothetical protein AMJ80_09685 [bacterium SM23_31]|nr:MAG: hypothetical protein AMJ80_09685 [bacterium SM23_31]